MRILGINTLSHDSAVSVIEDGEIKFAAHSERYSREKNDSFLNDDIMNEALLFGEPDKVVFFENFNFKFYLIFIAISILSQPVSGTFRCF